MIDGRWLHWLEWSGNKIKVTICQDCSEMWILAIACGKNRRGVNMICIIIRVLQQQIISLSKSP